MAEMENVKVDIKWLSIAKERLNNFVTNIVLQKENMEGGAEDLKEYFKGRPADAFFLVIKADLTELNHAISALKTLLQYVENAYENYETCERVVSGIVGEMAEGR